MALISLIFSDFLQKQTFLNDFDLVSHYFTRLITRLKTICGNYMRTCTRVKYFALWTGVYVYWPYPFNFFSRIDLFILYTIRVCCVSNQCTLFNFSSLITRRHNRVEKFARSVLINWKSKFKAPLVSDNYN